VGPELRPVELVAGVEEEDVDALAREVPGRHAAGGAAADHDHRVHLLRLDDLHAGPSATRMI
jgi:hypothetical protein